MKAISPERETAVLGIAKHFLTTLPRYKDKLNNTYTLPITIALIARREYPSWFLTDDFSDIELREAFASAINEGMITISYKGIVFRGLCLVICIELETLSNIYQYYWRSRWVLTLVNFLINSQKTSKRLSQKAAVVIRHFRKRLFKKPKQLV
jgi:ABC-type transport system substrate-binding protein